MRFLSLFSGIEAASVALKPLGWTCAGVAEIEPFPCSVLRHHYPDVPNLGDVTKVTQADIDRLGRIDIVIWGSPCQDLSIAGQRRGLDGERSGLFRVGWSIVQMAKKNGCRFSLWENVPGAFSTNGGRDFMRVVATMAGLESFDPPRFGTEGVVVGPGGFVEWATLDAQWFGVAQQRRRVFALADFGDWSRRPPILLEPEGVRGHSSPRREAGKKVAGTFTARTRSGGWSSGIDPAAGGYMIPEVAQVLRSGGDGGVPSSRGENLIPEVCKTLTRSNTRFDSEMETFVPEVAATLSSSGPPFSRPGNAWAEENAYIAFPINTQVALRHKKLGERTGLGIGEDGDPSYTLGANHSHAVAHSPCTDPGDPTPTLQTDGKLGVAYSEDVSPALKCNTGHTHREDGEAYVVGFDCKASGAHGFSIGDVSPTLRSMSHSSSHQNGGGHSAVLASNLVVRRLTPLECARLQGFSDDYLMSVPWKGKASPPDGLMYRALGNSMAVPVIRWIGKKIMEAVVYTESEEL